MLMLRFFNSWRTREHDNWFYTQPPPDLTIDPSLPMQPWAARFPNPPDLCFDYRRLIEQEGGVARATQPEHRICIVGAGVTGLTAARELLRCGFSRITLIEQSRRVGGRHLTVVNSSASG
ncbi:FAD-dependent oxidoreductase [Pseudomonas putida]|uniref:FAD-dependent oxidoreductase n=2 Tax=Pseudomonas TaxID=286 RepID=UPI00322148A3